VIVRYRGQWETAHNRDGDPKYPIRTTATGEGLGVFDQKSGKIKEMIWVLTGTYRYVSSEKPRATAAVIEWRAQP
jgi:UDP-galactopyranose mutase